MRKYKVFVVIGLLMFCFVARPVQGGDTYRYYEENGGPSVYLEMIATLLVSDADGYLSGKRFGAESQGKLGNFFGRWAFGEVCDIGNVFFLYVYLDIPIEDDQFVTNDMKVHVVGVREYHYECNHTPQITSRDVMRNPPDNYFVKTVVNEGFIENGIINEKWKVTRSLPNLEEFEEQMISGFDKIK